MIPKNCIERFVERFKIYPSIVEINNTDNEIEKVISKSQLLWFKQVIKEDGKKNYVKRLYEYDPTGVFVYIKNNTEVFILTTIDRKNVVDFMINNLKIKKNGN